MTRTRYLVSGIAGVAFALGLGVSGMTDANAVLGFLDLAGRWEPGLALVMASALAVYAPVHRAVQKRHAPLLGGAWSAPPAARVDVRVVFGAALFGVGWGLGGYCPGPGLVSLASGSASAFIFVGGMVLGMLLHTAWLPRAGARGVAAAERC